MDDFQNALEGKISTETWDAEKLVEYHKFLATKTAEEKSEVSGLREAKRAETERVEKLRAEAAAAEEKIRKAESQPSAAPSGEAMSQFRAEQVEKAKIRLFSEVKLSESEKAVVLEKFARLDTGKLDADFIYQDLLSAVAAANPSKFLELSKSAEEQEAEAQAEIERQASSGQTPPSGQEKRKYSDETISLAKKAGITPEEAERQVAQGMSRTYN